MQVDFFFYFFKETQALAGENKEMEKEARTKSYRFQNALDSFPIYTRFSAEDMKSSLGLVTHLYCDCLVIMDAQHHNPSLDYSKVSMFSYNL